MLRGILGVIAGYVVMFVVVFGSFTAAYLAMGAEKAFRPGTYDVSMLWIAISIVLGLVAAIAGGLVCAAIAKGGKAPMALAILVVVLGVLMAIPTLNAPDAGAPVERTGDVGNMAAMQSARTPSWVAFLNPVIGAVGVMLGAGLRKKR